MNIIKSIRHAYFGLKDYPMQRFIPIKEEKIQVDDYITYIEPHKITDYSFIEGQKCYIENFDLDTQEWVFKPLDKSINEEYRYVDISSLEVFPLNIKH